MLNFWKSTLKIKLRAEDFLDANFESSFDDALARNLRKHFNVRDVHVKTKTLEIMSFIGNYKYLIDGGMEKERYEIIRKRVEDGIFVLKLTKL